MKAKTKTQLFNELKALQGFNILTNRAVKESQNVRELKNSLAYYYAKYTCLAGQKGERRYFFGEVFFPSDNHCKSQILQLTEISKFMGYEIEKLTW
jgi:hypothetical protein